MEKYSSSPTPACGHLADIPTSAHSPNGPGHPAPSHRSSGPRFTIRTPLPGLPSLHLVCYPSLGVTLEGRHSGEESSLRSGHSTLNREPSDTFCFKTVHFSVVIGKPDLHNFQRTVSGTVRNEARLRMSPPKLLAEETEPKLTYCRLNKGKMMLVTNKKGHRPHPCITLSPHRGVSFQPREFSGLMRWLTQSKCYATTTIPFLISSHNNPLQLKHL